MKQPSEPLGMTVHSLPQPVEALAQQRTSGRLRMLLIMAICAAPVVASYTLYYGVRPTGGATAYSTLVQPTVPMPAVSATPLDGSAPLPLRSLAGPWLLVAVDSGACAAACEKRLYLQRQLRESLGKEKDRLDWVWLLSDDAAVPEALRAGVSTARVLRVDPQALAGWLQPEAGQALQEHLYVVDPMGNWMMRFPPNMDAAAAARAKRDIERLLRAAAGWDTAGRPSEP